MMGELSNHLWQSTLFAIVAGLLTVAFRKNRAQVRFWLWFGASFKFLVPFSLLIALGSHLQWTPAAPKIAAPAVSFTMMQISQPFPDTLPVASSTQGARDWAFLAILSVWACGFAGITLMRFRGWRRIRAAVRASTPIDIPATVLVRSSPDLLEPGVVGWLRPILLLPTGIAGRLTPPQLEAVLAHELCHVRRRDNLFASIHMMVETMFWFHPLVWWIGAKLVEERERACDEEVLRLGSEPHVYAEGIVNVCKLYVESPLVCVSGVTGSNLKKRIEAIMTNRIALKLNFAKRVALAVAGFTVLAVPIAIGVMNAPLIRAQSPQAKSGGASTAKFEVVSIKSCNAFRGDTVQSWSRGTWRSECTTVQHLVQQAYGLFANGHM
jgi:bla regulator protein blaR1